MKIRVLGLYAILAISLFAGSINKEKIPENMTVDTKETTQEVLATLNLITSKKEKIQIVDKANNIWEFKGYEGKLILISFFGTWCPPCKAEIPHLNSIRKEFNDTFEIIGVDVGQRDGTSTSQAELDKFISKYNIKFPVTTGGDNGQLFGAVSELNQRGSIPFMILFNDKGEYATHYIGMVPKEMIVDDIKRYSSINNKSK